MSAEPEMLLPEQPHQAGPLPHCHCGNNGLRSRYWRCWIVRHCPHCGHGWRERRS